MTSIETGIESVSKTESESKFETEPQFESETESQSETEIQTQTGPRFVAVCRECNTMTVSTERSDGSVRPLAVPENCVCGDGDFERLPE